MLLIRFGFVTAPLSCRIYIAACGSHNVFFKFDVTVDSKDSDSTFAFYIINNCIPTTHLQNGRGSETKRKRKRSDNLFLTNSRHWRRGKKKIFQLIGVIKQKIIFCNYSIKTSKY